MRKILLTTALVLPLSGFAFAQDAVTPVPETTAETAADAAAGAADAAEGAADAAAGAAGEAADAADAAGDAAADAADAAGESADAAADTAATGAEAAAETADSAADAAADSADAADASAEAGADAAAGDASGAADATEQSAEAAAAAALESEMANSDKIVREQAGNELRIDWVTGASVKSPADESVGEVRDVIVDAESGQVIAAIIGVGGFLGIGEKQIAVPWEQLTINYDAQEITTELTKDEAKAAPEYVFREREAAPAPAPAAADPAAAPAAADPAAAPAPAAN